MTLPVRLARSVPSLLLSAMLLVIAISARAQEKTASTAETDAAEVAKALSNPVADLVSIPFQFNWDGGVGPNEDVRYLLNIQPVVPFSLGKKWTLISRWIMPYISQPTLAPGLDPVSGPSDVVFSAFFSPKGSSLIWGVGPVLVLPATTDPLLGAGKWSVGPTFVVLKQFGPWTTGMLANQYWSFADTGNLERDDVNQALFQPFLAYVIGSGTTLSLNAEAVAQWEAPSGQEWTVPLNVGISKVTKLGPFPFSVGGYYGHYVESPDGGPEWKFRTVFTLILPAKK